MCWTAQFRHDSDVYLLCLLPLLGLLPGSVSDLSDDTKGISRTILHSTGSVKSFKWFKIVLTESGCAQLFEQLSPELDCDMFHGESIKMDVRLFRVGHGRPSDCKMCNWILTIISYYIIYLFKFELSLRLRNMRNMATTSRMKMSKLCKYCLNKLT